MKTTDYPEDWEVRKLKEVASINMGQSPPGKSYNEKGKGMPFLQGKATFGSIYPTSSKYTTDPKKTANEDEILISVRAPVGDVNIADKPYCIGRGLTALSMQGGSNWFLFYYLIKNKHKLQKESSGSTFKSINKSNLQNFELAFPPLQEQKNIAAVLSTVQSAIEKTENLISATQELKKSLMQQLFTYGPVPVDEAENVELRETEIGKVPEDWELTKLKELADVSSGGTPSRNKKKYWENANIPWVKTSEIRYEKIKKTEEFITEEGLRSITCDLYPKGTLLMAMYGQGKTRGQVGILGINAAINQACAAINPNEEKIKTNYLYHYLTKEYLNIREIAHGSSRKNLNQGLIKALDIPVPRLEIQDAIAKSLSIIDKKTELAKRKKFALEKLFNSFLDNLMMGRVRVNELNF